ALQNKKQGGSKMSEETTYSKGLKGVIACETAVSLLDTEQEKIIIRGQDLIELSQTKTYADIVYLLMEGNLPTEEERDATEKRLTSVGKVPENIIDILKLLPEHTHAMDGQRTAISILGGYDDNITDRSTVANKERAYTLMGQLPSITVNSYRILNGQESITPDTSMSYSANFLYMITGERTTELQEKIFDQALLLYSEHEMPNSTFTSRVIASTNSDMYGALAGAVASLKGNLHGGANEAVMEMLNEAETVEGFETLLKNKLANKEKVMGFGHRVYMDRMDTRALEMKKALSKLSELTGDTKLLDMCQKGEEVIKEAKRLYPNLYYYSAPILWMLGIPIDLYTPIFFSSRVAGLCAHIIEQHDNNYLFRPRVKYTGAPLA